MPCPPADRRARLYKPRRAQIKNGSLCEAPVACITRSAGLPGQQTHLRPSLERASSAPPAPNASGRGQQQASAEQNGKEQNRTTRPALQEYIPRPPSGQDKTNPPSRQTGRHHLDARQQKQKQKAQQGQGRPRNQSHITHHTRTTRRAHELHTVDVQSNRDRKATRPNDHPTYETNFMKILGCEISKINPHPWLTPHHTTPHNNSKKGAPPTSTAQHNTTNHNAGRGKGKGKGAGGKGRSIVAMLHRPCRITKAAVYIHPTPSLAERHERN